MVLEEILAKSEGKTLEFKLNTHSKERILASVIAFANSSGGQIVIGIEDQAKQVIGVSSPYLEEERLASFIYDSVTPALVFNIEIFPWRKTHIVIVDVPISGARPHYIRSKGVETSCYVRAGSTNRLADAAMRSSIQKSLSVQSYDEEVCYGSSESDLDMATCHQAFSSIRLIMDNDVFSLGLAHKEGRQVVPSIGGVILFSQNRERFLPDAWLKAGCFKGMDRTIIADTVDIHDYGINWVEHGMQFIRRHLKVGLDIEGLRHTEQWEIPQAALREALVNAVIHADYMVSGSPLRISIFDDRVEIENPGLLPSGLSLDDMKAGYSKVRNRVLARVFRELKQTEQWGSGVQRIVNLCKDFGLREPSFEEIIDRFRVTLFRYRTYPVGLDVLGESIMNALKNAGQASTSELSKTVSYSEKTVRKRLNLLIEKGLVQEISRNPKDPRKKFVLSQKV